MSSAECFTEEEIRTELENLGYCGFTDEVLKKFKNDLTTLLIQEPQLRDKPTDHQIGLTSVLENTEQNKNKSVYPENTKKYLNDISTLNEKNNREVDNLTDSSEKRVIKRKTLKYENGKAKILEESYVSSLSGDRNSYENAPVHIYPKRGEEEERLTLLNSKKRSKSTGNLQDFFKVKAKNSSRLSIHAYGDKQCDPVIRYHQYKKYWETRKPPGENPHKALRWTIREQMLDYDPIAEYSLKRMPNIFKIPCERRTKPISRWNSCSSLNERNY